MPRLSRSLLAYALTCAALWAPRPAFAQQLFSEIFVESEILGIPRNVPSLQGSAGPLEDSFDFLDDDLILPDGSASVATHVEFGHFRLRAALAIAADAFDAGVSLDGGTRATGSFVDIVTIDAPGQMGMPGSFVPVVRVDGQLAAAASGEDDPFQSFASADVVVTLGPGSQQIFRSCNTTTGQGPACISGDPLGVHVFSPVPFTFGIPFNLSLRADATTFQRTVPSGTSDATADFDATFEWLGFDAVMDGGGQSVGNYTVSSFSGVDWAQPVPEADGARAALALAVAFSLWVGGGGPACCASWGAQRVAGAPRDSDSRGNATPRRGSPRV